MNGPCHQESSGTTLVRPVTGISGLRTPNEEGQRSFRARGHPMNGATVARPDFPTFTIFGSTPTPSELLVHVLSRNWECDLSKARYS